MAHELGMDAPLKLGAVMGLVGAAGGFFGAEWVPRRVLSAVDIDDVIPWAYLLSGRTRGATVRIVSGDPACPV
jgi:hypothetical protein